MRRSMKFAFLGVSIVLATVAVMLVVAIGVDAIYGWTRELVAMVEWKHAALFVALMFWARLGRLERKIDALSMEVETLRANLEDDPPAFGQVTQFPRSLR